MSLIFFGGVELHAKRIFQSPISRLKIGVIHHSTRPWQDESTKKRVQDDDFERPLKLKAGATTNQKAEKKRPLSAENSPPPPKKNETNGGTV